MEFARFFIVAVAGLALDLAVAWSAARFFGLPLWLSAATGFTVAAIANYTLHELWTFQSAMRRLSAARALRYCTALAMTLGTRVAIVAALAAILSDTLTLPVLIAGAGASFCINYLINKHFVFFNRTDLRGSISMISSAETTLIAGSKKWELPNFEVAVHAARTHSHALVIPVINEGERIRNQLLIIRDAKLPVDVIVADGGSTDGSLDPAFTASAGVRAVLIKTGPGKLSAQLRMAYAWCLREGYEGIVTIDGNGKDGVAAVARMVTKLEDGYDYVQGSRYLPGGVAENTPLERTIANRGIHAPLLSLAGRHWFTDTTNGFRAYSARYLLDPRVQPFRDVFQRYELLFYLTVRAGQIGMRVAQVPVQRRYPPNTPTPTKINNFAGKFEVLKETFAVAFGCFSP